MLKPEQIKPGGFLTTIHDQKLTELLHQISRNIEMAQSKDELIATIGQVKSFGAPLKFSHSRYKLLALFTGLIALATGLFSDEFYIKFHYQSTAFTVFFALCTAALIFFMWLKSSRVRSLAERLYLRALLFDNQLYELTSELSLFESQLFNDYCEFRRGNYSREIKKGYRVITRALSIRSITLFTIFIMLINVLKLKQTVRGVPEPGRFMIIIIATG
ncbi:hypothetical protein ID360_004120 [Salmonella enterica]|nr:hypothetical protein [Salmonella enterica]EGH0940739.1 hypothetical protein [Salmonella enterica]EGR7877146.1 hypothetical protein [Salmonella enterica]EGS9619985.1 hypothetical protein [Salmonella enterica]EHR1132330.1 hypothetical protein [Salmonella enterica]